jgi:hypothetical protein
MELEIPELPWLIVGAEVSEVWGSRFDDCNRTKVERFTKTLVVLENGNRYRKDSLDRSYLGGCLKAHHGGTWGWSTHLIPTNHEKVREITKTKLIKSVAHKVEGWMGDLRNDPNDISHARRAHKLLGEFLERHDAENM